MLHTASRAAIPTVLGDSYSLSCRLPIPTAPDPGVAQRSARKACSSLEAHLFYEATRR